MHTHNDEVFQQVFGVNCRNLNIVVIVEIYKLALLFILIRSRAIPIYFLSIQQKDILTRNIATKISSRYFSR